MHTATKSYIETVLTVRPDEVLAGEPDTIEMRRIVWTTIDSRVLALPLDLSRHERTIRGTLPTDRIDTIVETIVMPLMKLHSRG